MSRRQPIDRVMHFACNCKMCLSYRELPTKILVKNAFEEEVNGRYYRVERRDGIILYAKNGICQKERHRYGIYSDLPQDGAIVWKIGENMSNADTTRVMYYGTGSEKNGSQLLPPKTGWKVLGPHLSMSRVELSYNYPENVMDNINKESRTIRLLNDRFFLSRVRILEARKPEMRKIPHRADQDKIYASMFRFLFSNPCDHSMALDKVTKDFHIAHLKERYTTLELVVWKAVCRMYYPNDIGTYALMSWWESGWKELKTEMRNSRDINVIMVHVITFEGK